MSPTEPASPHARYPPNEVVYRHDRPGPPPIPGDASLGEDVRHLFVPATSQENPISGDGDSNQQLWRIGKGRKAGTQGKGQERTRLLGYRQSPVPE
jgi:hypothetical protein